MGGVPRDLIRAGLCVVEAVGVRHASHRSTPEALGSHRAHPLAWWLSGTTKRNKEETEVVHALTVDQETIVVALRHHGYTVHVAQGAAQARVLANAQRFDLVLLAAELADGNGFRLCAELREHFGGDVIIILLLADDTPVRRVTAMQLGADDVVGVPYNEHELLARIEAHRRRCALNNM